VERKHGKLGRVWVFDRGIVSAENLNLLRSRGASYLVATPKRLLAQFQKELLAEDWTQVANHPQIQVKRIERDGELYVLTRSLARAEKERAMRQRVLKGLRKDLAGTASCLGFAFEKQARQCIRPNRVHHVLFMDWSFASGCSPPRLSTTQLPSATNRPVFPFVRDFHPTVGAYVQAHSSSPFGAEFPDVALCKGPKRMPGRASGCGHSRIVIPAPSRQTGSIPPPEDGDETTTTTTRTQHYSTTALQHYSTQHAARGRGRSRHRGSNHPFSGVLPSHPSEV
jgi:hypothetical protein